MKSDVPILIAFAALYAVLIVASLWLVDSYVCWRIETTVEKTAAELARKEA